MATVNLGSIKFKWKGTYSGATAYTIDDVVEYNGSSFICISNSTGNLPTNATYFEQMSQKGSDGTNGTDGTDFGTILTTQGDIVYRDASGIARLGAGTSGQALITNGTGANPSWGDVSGGLVQVVQGTLDSTSSTSSLSMVDTGLSVSITPTSASNKVLCFFNANVQPNGGQYSAGISIVRGSTAIRTGSNGSVRGTAQFWSPSDLYHMNHFTGMVLDSPNTTSATTYKVQFASGYSGETIYINRNYTNANHFDSTSTIICMEVSV